jgi:Domain of unknown function (DUF4145)
MQAVTLPNGQFSLRGKCPYPACGIPSIFVTIVSASAGISQTSTSYNNRVVAIMQCQGCQKYILGFVEHPQNSPTAHQYKEHYPIGSPNQAVADEIPEHIKDDFKEALRCIFVDAFNATAEMCRRALEASCLDLGAPSDKVLEKMIDWLEDKRIITPYLKEAAHKVRLGGNRGAHPPSDGPAPIESPRASEDGPVEKIEREHAEAIVAFTSEFFHHVYVGPKLLGKYDFSKAKPPKPKTISS